MFKNIVIFVCIICFSSNCNAVELAPKNNLILEKFFRIMIQKAEGGYVLMNAKPVCMHSFANEDYFFQDSEFHEASVCLKEGAAIWKKIDQNPTSQNIIVHIYNEPDLEVGDHVHVLFINKKLFLNVVQENLSLFQYVLGPNVTPEDLLKKLIDPQETFFSVIKSDKTLIGILLGYGTQNSLFVSRAENIQDSLFSSKSPPLKSNVSKLNEVSKEYLHMLLRKPKKSFFAKTQIEQSFGYPTLEQEFKDLNSKIELPSYQLSEQTPVFIFGRLKDDKESDKLVKNLELLKVKLKFYYPPKHFLKMCFA